MKYNLFSDTKTDKSQEKLAKIQVPFKIPRLALKKDAFLFRDQAILDKQMSAAIQNEAQTLRRN